MTGKGTNRSKVKKRNKLFAGKPKSKKLSKIVRLTSVRDARIATKDLEKEFADAKKIKAKKDRQKKMLHIKRSANLAMNRANASAKRRTIKPETKKRLYEVADIYSESHDRMQAEYLKEINSS